MLNSVTVKQGAERRFLRMYKTVHDREATLSDEAKIVQYGAVLRYFMKFLQQADHYSTGVMTIVYRIEVKLGDIYYQEALQNQDNSRYSLAAAYYIQALSYALRAEDKRRVLLLLKNIYYYLGDEEALVKVERSWAEHHDDKDQFFAFMLLAQNTLQPQIKAEFLSKALDKVMAQEESFYNKYMDTLNVCSQLTALYELLGEKEKTMRIKNLRDNTMKLLN